MLQMKTRALCFLTLLLLLLPCALEAAPYRLNRTADSALALYVDNLVSAAADDSGTLHLVYTDASTGGHWQIFYRNLEEGYWSIPANLSAQVPEIADNRSPQIVFEPATRGLYVAWLGLSATSTARSYKLFVGKVEPGTGQNTIVATFSYGSSGFQPRIATASGKIFFLSEERAAGNRTLFRMRVFLTSTGEWIEKVLQTTATEGVAYPTLAASPAQAALTWVRTTSQGYDIMASVMPAAAQKWDEAKPVFRSPAAPGSLVAGANGQLISLIWTLRGGGRNSIFQQMVSHDGGGTWKGPRVLYSVGATATASVVALTDRDILVLLHHSEAQGDFVRLKYSRDGGESWTPSAEIDAIDIGPGKDAVKAQGASILGRDTKTLVLAWEEWLNSGPVIAYKEAPLQGLSSAPRRFLLTARQQPAGRFPYSPQLWMAGKKVYITYGSKIRPQYSMSRIATNDIYVVEVPAPAAVRPRPAAKKQQ